MTPISDDLKIRNTNSAAWQLYDAERAERERLEADVVALKKQLGAKQARIDELMIEHCPNEVTDEQWAEWCSHQHPAPHPLWETGEVGVPSAILDRNGEVVLGLCKVCGRGECELDEPCSPKVSP